MSIYKLAIFISGISFLFFMGAHAQENEEEEPPTEDFLEFLIEIEDATGDGFETWLETVLDKNTAQN